MPPSAEGHHYTKDCPLADPFLDPISYLEETDQECPHFYDGIDGPLPYEDVQEYC